MDRNTEGQKRVYDAQPWNQQAGYRMPEFAGWEWPDATAGGRPTRGGEFKVSDGGKLAAVTVDEAGHTSPGDQKEAVAFIVECWFRQRRGGLCPV